MSGTVVPRSGLDAEGDQVGADFRLGERAGAWSARRYSGSFGCGLIRYDAGEPVTFGRLSVDQSGISSPQGAAAKPWSIHWRDISEIEMLMYGHRMSISYSKWRTRKVSLDGAPNDFLARYVIGYAASRTGVRITGGTGAGR